MSFSVSCTSRKIRDGEAEGTDYFFISVEQFKNKIKENDFLEYAIVHDNYYGTCRKEVDKILRTGKDCLLDIDVQGGVNLMSKNIDAVYIFIAPPSIEVLRERLLNRSTDTIEVINKRIKNAEKELEYKDKYQFIIVNDDLNKAYDELVKIIY